MAAFVQGIPACFSIRGSGANYISISGVDPRNAGNIPHSGLRVARAWRCILCAIILLLLLGPEFQGVLLPNSLSGSKFREIKLWIEVRILFFILCACSSHFCYPGPFPFTVLLLTPHGYVPCYSL